MLITIAKTVKKCLRSDFEVDIKYFIGFKLSERSKESIRRHLVSLSSIKIVLTS